MLIAYLSLSVLSPMA